MRKVLFALGVCTVVAISFSAPSFADEVDDKYPGPWRDDANAGIMRALVKNDITGCGYFEYRPSKDSREEYIVRCGESHYIVFTGTGEVMGPYGR